MRSIIAGVLGVFLAFFGMAGCIFTQRDWVKGISLAATYVGVALISGAVAAG